MVRSIARIVAKGMAVHHHNVAAAVARETGGELAGLLKCELRVPMARSLRAYEAARVAVRKDWAMVQALRTGVGAEGLAPASLKSTLTYPTPLGLSVRNANASTANPATPATPAPPLATTVVWTLARP